MSNKSSTGRHLTASVKERGVDWVRRQGGRVFSSEPLMPGFLLAGGKRCGSTTLHAAIIDHPHVLRPRTAKSSHYFDVNHDRGSDWYRSHFPSVASAARMRDRTGVMPITGESSPYYSFHPLAAERIGRELPDARIVLCVREPAARAWSQFQYETARGFEDLDFTAALDAEDERLKGQLDVLLAGQRSAAHRHHTYLARGRYIEHLEMLEAHIPRSQIHVVIAEELFSRPAETLSDLWSFLDLPAHNVTSVPQLKATATSKGASSIPAADQTRLAQYFAPFNARLASWLGRDHGWPS